MLVTVRSKKLQLINGCEQLESKRGNKYFLRYEQRDALKPFRLCFLSDSKNVILIHLEHKTHSMLLLRVLGKK